MKIPIGVIKISKIAAAPDACLPTPEWETYNSKSRGSKTSVPINYTITGNIFEQLQVGKQVYIEHDREPSEDYSRFFRSSVVESFDENTFTTKNSVYSYMFL